MFKRLFLFIALACITIGYSQQSYYNDVNLNLTGITLKEDLNIKYMQVSGDFIITNMNVAYDIDSKYTKINGKSFSKYLIDEK